MTQTERLPDKPIDTAKVFREVVSYVTPEGSEMFFATSSFG